jgi:hypothetical protein
MRNLLWNSLNYWPQSTKELDENYYQYYNWVTNMKLDKTYKPNLANVLALANKCPQKSGKVVYSARALYNGLTHSAHIFDNNCNAVASRQITVKNEKQQTSIKDVSVYPNPSTDGIVNIQLKASSVKESGYWIVTITDIYGKTIANKTLSGLQSQVNIGTVKGIYFINVRNEFSGKNYINKIILQ